MSTASAVRLPAFEKTFKLFGDDAAFRKAVPAPRAADESGFIGKVRSDKLTDIFNEFAADAVRDYAKLKGSFMVIDGKTGYAAGDIDKSKLEVDAHEVGKFLAGEMEKDDKSGGYADTHHLNPMQDDFMNHGDIYAIRYNMFMPFSGNAEHDIWFALNHEKGHAVVPGALDMASINYDEMAADLLAMMDHIQRFGDADNSYITLLARERSKNLMLGDPTHFTNPALAEFLRQKDSLDVKHMTPEEKTAKAAEIAGKCQMNARKVTALMDLRQRAEDAYVARVDRTGEKGLGIYLMALVAELLSKDATKAEFDAGMEVLQPYLDNVPGRPSPLPVNSPKWAAIAKGLAYQAENVKHVPMQSTPVQGLPASFPHIEGQARVLPPQRAFGYAAANDDHAMTLDELQEHFAQAGKTIIILRPQMPRGNGGFGF